MDNIMIVLQYVLAAVGAFALILQAVAKITGVRPGSRPHKRLSKLQAVVQTVVDGLGVLALNVGGGDGGGRDEADSDSDRGDQRAREKSDGKQA